MEIIFDIEKIESRIQELKKAEFKKVLATLKANKVMLEVRIDGVYTRLAGNGDSEAFTLVWANSYPFEGYKAAESKGGWTEDDLEKAFYSGVSFGKDPEENYDWERWLQNLKDFKTQEAIYKNYPNLNASKEEMDEMRKLK